MGFLFTNTLLPVLLVSSKVGLKKTAAEPFAPLVAGFLTSVSGPLQHLLPYAWVFSQAKLQEQMREILVQSAILKFNLPFLDSIQKTIEVFHSISVFTTLLQDNF